MHTTGNVTNNCYYKGVVSIKYKRNNKVYDIKTLNSGTTLLTDTITKALAGQDISDSIPKYLDFQYVTDTHTGSLLVRRVPFTGIVWGDAAKDTDTNDSTLLLTATILPTDRIDMTIENLTLKLAMKTSDGRTLANIQSSPQDDSLYSLYKSLSSGTEAIIEWRMIFKNA